MGNITMNGQTIFEQVGTNRPTTGAGFPAGHVLQVVTTNPPSDSVTTTTDIVVWTKTVTPISSSSIFYIFSSWNFRNTGAICGLVNGSVVDNPFSRGTGGAGLYCGVTDHVQQSFHWKYENTSTNDIIFSERLDQVGPDSTAEIWSYGYMSSIIMEVKK